MVRAGQQLTLSQLLITTGGTITPQANDGAALGSTSLMWSDGFFASGAVLNWNNGAVTITESSGSLTLASTQETVLLISSSNTNSTRFSVANTSTGGKTYTFPVGGSANVYGAGAFVFYNVTDDQGPIVINNSGNIKLGHDSAFVGNASSKVHVHGNLSVGTGNRDIASPSNGLGVQGASLFGSSVKSENATAGVGYATGAGGTVTQATSRTTGVTLNKICGAITLVSAAGSATPATFTVTNSAVEATDVVKVCQKSGTDLYHTLVTAVAAGSFNITFFTTGGTTTEQPVFNFAVLKAVAA